MSFLLCLKRYNKNIVKSVANCTNFAISTRKNKISMINLKKTKEELSNFSIKPYKPEEENEGIKFRPTKNVKKEKISLEKYFILKEKQISSKILKASSEKEIMNIYYEENHKKPIHYCLMFYKFISLYKDMKALNKMQRKQLKAERKQIAEIRSLWKNANFIKICEKVLEKLDTMNPDSLNKILQGLSMLKKHHKLSQTIYKNIIDLLLQENNILLFDTMQSAKFLVIFRKISKRMKNILASNQVKLVKLILNKIKGEFDNLPTNINLKIYHCLPSISQNELKILENLTHIIYKRITKLKSIEIFMFFSGLYKMMPTSYLQKPESKLLIDNLLNMIEHKGTIFKMNVKQLNLFLEILYSSKICNINNKDLFIEAIVHKQIENFSRILTSKNKQKNEKLIHLPSFNNFLKKINELQHFNNEIITFFAFIRDQKISLATNEFVNILNVIAQQVKYDKSKLNLDSMISFYIECLKTSNFHQMKPEIFPFFIKSLYEINIKSENEAILKRVFGFFSNSVYKFSDYNLCLSIIYIKLLQTRYTIEEPIVLELFIKSMQRFILKNEYHLFEEIEEIEKLRNMGTLEKSNIQKVSSYAFIRENLDERYKFMIKRHTQIVNALWVVCNLMFKENQGHQLKSSMIWKEFAVCLNNVGIAELFTIDNIQKLYDIKNILEINKFSEIDIFFNNPIFQEIFSQQEEFILKGFIERKKKLRNLIVEELEKHMNIVKKSIKLEICSILKDKYPIDICIHDSSKNMKIGIILTNIYEERNEALMKDKESYKEYFRIKESYMKFHFGGDIYFMVKETQINDLIKDIFDKLEN